MQKRIINHNKNAKKRTVSPSGSKNAFCIGYTRQLFPDNGGDAELTKVAEYSLCQ